MTNTTKLTITRTSIDTYRVDTDTLLSDGSYRADGCLKLHGNVLRSFERPGHIRIGGLMNLTLGPLSLARVSALAVGESVTF
jgi:hypothetical protein